MWKQNTPEGKQDTPEGKQDTSEGKQDTLDGNAALLPPVCFFLQNVYRPIRVVKLTLAVCGSCGPSHVSCCYDCGAVCTCDSESERISGMSCISHTLDVCSRKHKKLIKKPEEQNLALRTSAEPQTQTLAPNFLTYYFPSCVNN